MSDASAKELWQEKLNSLQAVEALAVDPAEKFKIGKDIAEAKRKLQELDAEAAATSAIGRSAPAVRFDISRIIKYAPAELIGREAETKLLNDAWAKAQNNETSARTSSPSSRSAARGRPRSWRSGQRSWRTRIGRGATRRLRGPSTARARGNRPRRRPTCF